MAKMPRRKSYKLQPISLLVTNSFLLLVVRPAVPSSFLFLRAMASNLLAMASRAMASRFFLLAMASRFPVVLQLQVHDDPKIPFR